MAENRVGIVISAQNQAQQPFQQLANDARASAAALRQLVAASEQGARAQQSFSAAAQRNEQLLRRITAASIANVRATRELNRNMQQLARSMQRQATTTDRVNESLGAGVFILSQLNRTLIRVTTTFVSAALELEQMELALRTVTGSAAAAEIQYQRLVDVARLPGLSVTQALQASQQLIALGIEGQRTTDIIRQFGNALAVSGRRASDLAPVVSALRQITGEGKILQEDLSILTSRIAVLTPILRRLYGGTRAEDIRNFFKGIGQEAGTSSLFIEQIVAELARLPRASDTTANALENLRDSFTRAAGAVGMHFLPIIKAAATTLEGFFMFLERNDWASGLAAVITTVTNVFLGFVGSISLTIHVASQVAHFWRQFSHLTILGGIALGKFTLIVAGVAAALAGLAIAFNFLTREKEKNYTVLEQGSGLYVRAAKFIDQYKESIDELSDAERRRATGEGGDLLTQLRQRREGLETELKAAQNLVRDLQAEEERIFYSGRSRTAEQVQQAAEAIGRAEFQVARYTQEIEKVDDRIQNIEDINEKVAIDPAITKSVADLRQEYERLDKSIRESDSINRLRVQYGLLEDDGTEALEALVDRTILLQQTEEKLQEVRDTATKDQLNNLRRLRDEQRTARQEQLGLAVAAIGQQVDDADNVLDRDNRERLERQIGGLLSDPSVTGNLRQQLLRYRRTVAGDLRVIRQKETREEQEELDKRVAAERTAAQRIFEARTQARERRIAQREEDSNQLYADIQAGIRFVEEETAAIERAQASVTSPQTASSLRSIAENAASQAASIRTTLETSRDLTTYQREQFPILINGWEEVQAQAERATENRQALEEQTSQLITLHARSQTRSQIQFGIEALTAHLSRLAQEGEASQDLFDQTFEARRDLQGKLTTVAEQETRTREREDQKQIQSKKRAEEQITRDLENEFRKRQRLYEDDAQRVFNFYNDVANRVLDIFTDTFNLGFIGEQLETLLNARTIQEGIRDITANYALFWLEGFLGGVADIAGIGRGLDPSSFRASIQDRTTTDLERDELLKFYSNIQTNIDRIASSSTEGTQVLNDLYATQENILAQLRAQHEFNIRASAILPVGGNLAITEELTRAANLLTSIGIEQSEQTKLFEEFQPENIAQLQALNDKAQEELDRRFTEVFQELFPQFGREGETLRGDLIQDLAQAGFSEEQIQRVASVAYQASDSAIQRAIALTSPGAEAAQQRHREAQETRRRQLEEQRKSNENLRSIIFIDRDDRDALERLVRGREDTPLQDLIRNQQGILRLSDQAQFSAFLLGVNEVIELQRESLRDQSLERDDPEAAQLIRDIGLLISAGNVDASRLPPGIEGFETGQAGFESRIRDAIIYGLSSGEAYTDLLDDVGVVLTAAGVLPETIDSVFTRLGEEIRQSILRLRFGIEPGSVRPAGIVNLPEGLPPSIRDIANLAAQERVRNRQAERDRIENARRAREEASRQRSIESDREDDRRGRGPFFGRDISSLPPITPSNPLPVMITEPSTPPPVAMATEPVNPFANPITPGDPNSPENIAAAQRLANLIAYRLAGGTRRSDESFLRAPPPVVQNQLNFLNELSAAGAQGFSGDVSDRIANLVNTGRTSGAAEGLVPTVPVSLDQVGAMNLASAITGQTLTIKPEDEKGLTVKGANGGLLIKTAPDSVQTVDGNVNANVTGTVNVGNSITIANPEAIITPPVITAIGDGLVKQGIIGGSTLPPPPPPPTSPPTDPTNQQNPQFGAG